MIVVIGGGVSGLTVGHYLHRQGRAVQLFEASDRVGGAIQSVLEQDYRVELGPNSLLADNTVREIIAEIGLAGRILPPRSVSRHRYIYKAGRYRRLPGDPLRLLGSGFFSVGAKLALFREPFKRSRSPEGESVAGFFARRFSQEIVDYAVNPFVSGIYAGDPRRLVMARTFPSLLDYERRHGSLIRGALRGGGGSGRRSSFSFDTGMEALTAQLARDLPLALNTPVERLESTAEGWRVLTPQGAVAARRVVLAVPAYRAATLLAGVEPRAELLASMDYPPLCVVHSVYARDAVGHSLDGFGGLHPRVENLFSAGSIWSSSLFPDRCPQDRVLLTTFVGGAQYRAHTALADTELLARTAAELAHLYDIRQPPLWQRLTRWERAIPQYDAASGPAWELAGELAGRGLHVCANWWGGVSAADCLKKGRELAHQLAVETTD